MKFGFLSHDALEKTDLSLPPDHEKTGIVLKKIKNNPNNGNPNVYVGCAKWGRDEWVGQLYPEGTKNRDFLANYVKHFNSIEVNATFYQTRKANVIKWAEEAPDGFKFCPKFTRRISHLKRLKEAEESTGFYVDAISSFGENLGMAFLQLPDNFSAKYLERLQSYIETFPDEIPITVELRNETWFADEQAFEDTFDMFEENNVGAVITDVAGRRDCVHQRLTNNSAFIRFNGYNWHPSDFTRLDDWVERIASWIEQGLTEIYFFMHQQDEDKTPLTADYFIERINGKCNLKILRPQFINRPKLQ